MVRTKLHAESVLHVFILPSTLSKPSLLASNLPCSLTSFLLIVIGQREHLASSQKLFGMAYVTLSLKHTVGT